MSTVMEIKHRLILYFLVIDWKLQQKNEILSGMIGISIYKGIYKIKTLKQTVSRFFKTDPSETRTPDPLIKSQMLYRLS